MKKILTLSGLLIVALLAGVRGATLLAQTNTFTSTTQSALSGPTVLSDCSPNDALFPQGGINVIDQWIDTYNATVSGVIEAHQNPPPFSCTEPGGEPPTAELRSLASQLKPWEKPDALDTLRETDIGAVLMEYGRIYGCTLADRELFLGPVTASQSDLSDLQFTSDFVRQQRLIDTEQVVAPAALRRTLGYIAGLDRLRPLQNNLLCLERASLDIRNALSLASQASACLPRIWDARGALRDIAP